MANKKLFEATTGTPSGTDNFAFGKAGVASKTITFDALKTQITVGKPKIVVIELGPWNMQADTSKEITSPVVLTKIRSVSALIRTDNDFAYIDYASAYVNGSNASASIAISHLVGKIVIYSLNGGYFDSINFSNVAGSYNRGWMTITYVD